MTAGKAAEKNSHVCASYSVMRCSGAPHTVAIWPAWIATSSTSPSRHGPDADLPDRSNTHRVSPCILYPRRRGSRGTEEGGHAKKGVRSCNPTFRGCGGELVHLVSLVYLVCVVRRTSETRQTRAPARPPLNRPPLAPRTYIFYRVMDTPLTLQ